MNNFSLSFRRLGGLWLTCGLLLTACGGGNAPPVDGKNPHSSGGRVPSATDSLMLQAVNAARATARQCQGKTFAAAPPVAWNGLLGNAAHAHAQDMAARGYLSHDTPEGLKPEDRVEQAGYTTWSTVGENIAAGYSTSEIDAVMVEWLGSKDGHCETLMNPAFKEVGFGYASATGGQYSAYWVQDFGSR